MLVFVDTNVLLYASDGQPVKQPFAHAWLEHLWDQQAGRVSAQVLSEYHTTACRKLSKLLTPDEAWKEVEAYFAWNPRPIDRDVLTQAREIQSRWKLNWWDCLIVAAARLQDCTLLLSEDLQDGMRSATSPCATPSSCASRMR